MIDALSYPEPNDVYPETVFEKALSSAIRWVLCDCSFALVPKLGLDLAVFVKQSGKSQVFFVEVKSYRTQRNGGLGFGSGRGVGPQVDLLLSSRDEFAILENHVRWAFADATRPCGSARYALLTCSKARGAAMGSVATGKQNNFRIAALDGEWVMWPVFCEYLRSFLRGNSVSAEAKNI